MSFVGIFRAKGGLAAIADSKSTIESLGRSEEDRQRHPNKLFTFPGGVAVTYGSNSIQTRRPSEIFSKKLFLEDIVASYLQRTPTLDANFFQLLLTYLSSEEANKEPIHFLIGRKIWDGNYQLEHHKIGCRYYGERILPPQAHSLIGGDPRYCEDFEGLKGLHQISDPDLLRRSLVKQLADLVHKYDKDTQYNSVGGMIQSYTLI